MLTPEAAQAETRRGVAAALIAYLTWGIYPVFYRQLGHIDPLQILAWRVIWSCAVLAAMFALIPRLHVPWDKLASARQLAQIALAALLVSTNWAVFIYAVSIGEILQASLGYFLNPTLSALLGIVLFGEKLNRLKRWSVFVAVAGMLSTFMIAGVVPILALTMACSFGFYAAVRKRSVLDSASGLYLETLIMLPVAAVFLWLVPLSPGTFEPATSFWLIASGVMTIIPLLTAVYAARRIPLSTFGLFQYIAPTMHLMLAVGLYGETMDLPRALAFATTLTSVALFAAGMLAERRPQARQALRPPSR